MAGTWTWPVSGPHPAGAVTGWMQASLAQEAEQRRLFPWLAVAFGVGVLAFFQAEGEPSAVAPALGLAVAGGAAWLLRNHAWPFMAAVALAALFAGFMAGVLRQQSVAAPVLTRITIAPLTGFVEAFDEQAGGGRLLIRVQALGSLAPENRPGRVRITLKKAAGLIPGDFVSLRARLVPLPGPAWPEGYDFGRDAYFRGIGAVGSVLGKVQMVEPPEPPPLALRVSAGIERGRNALTARIAGAIGGQPGAIAAALVTGKRGLISPETDQVLRAAGIYHIVSISGLHMVLAAGTVFGLVRALLAMVPGVALLWPVKKIAAFVAMTAAGAYCVFSGSEVATERSLLMCLVMLGAVLVDRPAISMRNLAIAAVLVLAREPEALLGPSFQMSFAAVAGLTAAAGTLTAFHRREPPVGWLDRALRWAVTAVLGLLVTTLVAGTATAPFSAYHFQSLSPYGVIGNAVTVPLVSAVVMPAAVLGLMALPFGLDRAVWEIMGAAVSKVMALSQWVADLSGSLLTTPAFGAGTLLLFALALLIICCLGSGLRWFALIPLALATAGAAMPSRYAVFVDREGTGAAVRADDGRLVVLGQPSRFVVEQWLKADGDDRKGDDPTLRNGVRCDRLGCVAKTRNGAVALITDRRAFPEDCERAALVVTRLSAPESCRAPVTIDKPVLARSGAVGVLATTSGFGPLTASLRPGASHPWSGRPGPVSSRVPDTRPATEASEEDASETDLPDPR